MRMSEFDCTAQGCPRKSRSKRKPGLCNTCYYRQFTGASPKFPADPLIDYMSRKGVGWPRTGSKPKRGARITLEHLDAVCIDHLGVHPAVVYGDLYYQECVA